MKEKIKKIIVKIICTLVITATCFCTISIIEQRKSFADSGHSTSHHSRSSSGSRSRSSSSSSRSRSSSSSRSRSSSSSSSSSSSGSFKNMSRAGKIITLLICLGLPLGWCLLILIFSKIGSKNRMKNTYQSTYKKETSSADAEKKIKLIKPNFNKDEFLREGFNIYKDIQVAWMNFDLESVRNLITDEMFNMYQSQLNVMEATNEQNIMKDMVIKKRKIVDAIVQNGVLTIVTNYTIEQYDYVADRTTGKLIRGESKYKMRVDYEMRFRQSINNDKILNFCPNCGADISKHNGSGVCEYCGTKIVSDNKNWVLTEKQVINQDYL